ncbi:hypothetical protein [Sporisorium scitamineum]|uniref:Uncharacterized protein n=1 Tax=Sporisorium scitamineum TaxID=49012 RepID=A0A0F7S035_9BASI|nr:hypothetical protein [Sporisorium scitamineum]
MGICIVVSNNLTNLGGGGGRSNCDPTWTRRGRIPDAVLLSAKRPKTK